MSAQDELPTGRTWGYVSHLHARIAELETALAKVTVERDEAREMAETYRDSAHYPDSAGPADALTWERATPTEGA